MSGDIIVLPPNDALFWSICCMFTSNWHFQEHAHSLPNIFQTLLPRNHASQFICHSALPYQIKQFMRVMKLRTHLLSALYEMRSNAKPRLFWSHHPRLTPSLKPVQWEQGGFLQMLLFWLPTSQGKMKAHVSTNDKVQDHVLRYIYIYKTATETCSDQYMF